MNVSMLFRGEAQLLEKVTSIECFSFFFLLSFY
jgi:hypothetical protein